MEQGGNKAGTMRNRVGTISNLSVSAACTPGHMVGTLWLHLIVILVCVVVLIYMGRALELHFGSIGRCVCAYTINGHASMSVIWRTCALL